MNAPQPEKLFVLDFLERRGWKLVSGNRLVYEFQKPCGHCLSINCVRGYDWYALYVNEKVGSHPVVFSGR